MTRSCPQCAIAINRIRKISHVLKNLDVAVIDVTKRNGSKLGFDKLTDTPYYLIEEKYVVPGTSSEDYVKNVIKTASINE